MSFELGFPYPDHKGVRVALAIVTAAELLQAAPSPSGNKDVLRGLLGTVSWEMRMLLSAW